MPKRLEQALWAIFAIAAGVLGWWRLPEPFNWLALPLALWLTAASYVDRRSYLMLDIFTLPLVLAGLGLSIWLKRPPMLDAALGAAFGYFSLWLVEYLYRQLRGRAGLGLGDAKLLAAAGAWCGALALPFIVLVASFSALCWIAARALAGAAVSRTTRIAFGPFLAIGFFSIWVTAHSELPLGITLW